MYIDMQKLIRKLICMTLLSLLSCFHTNVNASTECSSAIRGVNLAGAEFAGDKLPAMAGKNYFFPKIEHLQRANNAGFNAIRLPISWESLQPNLYGALDETYANLLLSFLNQAYLNHQVVIVDVHNYGRYKKELIGSAQVPSEAFADMWKKLATILHKHPALYAYGLMNEPHHTQGLWHITAQFGLNAIREVDTSHLIYVAGDDWSSASSWPKSNPQPFVTDPSDKIVYEAHIYFDDDFSGRYAKPIGNVNLKARTEARLLPFVSWLKKYKQKGVIGEWGVPTDDPAYDDATETFLSITNTECLDWFVWVAGYMRPSYVLSLDSLDGKPKHLLQKLKDRLIKEPAN
ncbi:glycoside hydrolase family 5 protein [Methylotenera mobilis]|uniref:Glycoside hydrolase family 5 n=1 Tax=Methylotenera mobilis (strain JLW8 / ATCC BAA-1282 / DSM 17540) TaxID=583345 RepID=C6WXP1_METML|nr:glycoside hydrolase family 5 protein [Methylotenera mobilis]ACT48690.1 glycoside hydrolase family 5 [Methylotenera mobilis JLW8]